MLLKELSEAIGVSGAEGQVRDLIMNAIEGHVDEMRIDTMGNLIALKRGTGASPLRGLLAAHMDEVGFIVTGHESNGLLSVEAVGGIDAKILPALRIVVDDKKRQPGHFVWKPIHFGGGQEIVSLSNMQVDIGTTSKDSAASAAPLGSRLAFDSQYIHLSDDVVRGKALDDRVGCAELIELCLGDPLPFDLYACFTVQEEVGLRGASVLVESIQPDFAIALEATACHEVPQDDDLPDQTTVTKLGQGAVMSLMDRTSIAHPRLLHHFIEVAEREGIPHQFRSPQFAGGTDAGILHKSGAGVPAITVSVPCRYLHGPHCMVSLQDIEAVLRLLRTALPEITQEGLTR